MFVGAIFNAQFVLQVPGQEEVYPAVPVGQMPSDKSILMETIIHLLWLLFFKCDEMR